MGNVVKCVRHLTDDEYRSNNTAFYKELRSVQS